MGQPLAHRNIFQWFFSLSSDVIFLLLTKWFVWFPHRSCGRPVLLVRWIVLRSSSCSSSNHSRSSLAAAAPTTHLPQAQQLTALILPTPTPCLSSIMTSRKFDFIADIICHSECGGSVCLSWGVTDEEYGNHALEDYFFVLNREPCCILMIYMRAYVCGSAFLRAYAWLPKSLYTCRKLNVLLLGALLISCMMNHVTIGLMIVLLLLCFVMFLLAAIMISINSLMFAKFHPVVRVWWGSRFSPDWSEFEQN